MAKFVDNSATSGDIYDGRLEYVGDGTESEGDPWLPINQTEIETRYIQDGTINLKDTGDGKGAIHIDTQWVAPRDVEWTVFGVYDVVLGTTFKTFALHYYGDWNGTYGTCDVWYGDQNNEMTLASADTGLKYIPPLTSFLMHDVPLLPIIPFGVFDTVNNIYDTDSHEIVLRVNTRLYPMLDFDVGNVSYDTNNGNLTGTSIDADGLTYRFQYTADVDVVDPTNTFTVDLDYYDINGNQATENAVSNNFEISTGAEVRLEENGDFIDPCTEWNVWNPEGTLAYDSGSEEWDWATLNPVTAGNSGIDQTLSMTQGQIVTLEISVVKFVGGSINIRLENMDETIIPRTSNGVYQQEVTSTVNGDNKVLVQADYGTGFEGSVVQVKVIQN